MNPASCPHRGQLPKQPNLPKLCWAGSRRPTAWWRFQPWGVPNPAWSGRRRSAITIRMKARPGRSRAHQSGAWTRIPLAFVAVVGLVVLVGCGGGKPAYCADRASLENSIKGLKDLNNSSGISGLEEQLKKIDNDATKVASSAKSDFPSETSAIKSSVDVLKSTIQALPSSPTAAEIATVAAKGASMVSAVKNFMDASSSKCS